MKNKRLRGLIGHESAYGDYSAQPALLYHTAVHSRFFVKSALRLIRFADGHVVDHFWAVTLCALANKSDYDEG